MVWQQNLLENMKEKPLQLEKFLDMESRFFSQPFLFSMVKGAVPIGNNPKYVFAILQGDSDRIEVLAELNASKIMILLPYQVPSSRCIFVWSWWLLQ